MHSNQSYIVTPSVTTLVDVKRNAYHTSSRVKLSDSVLLRFS